jgi:hypothetical protein
LENFRQTTPDTKSTDHRKVSNRADANCYGQAVLSKRKGRKSFNRNAPHTILISAAKRGDQQKGKRYGFDFLIHNPDGWSAAFRIFLCVRLCNNKKSKAPVRGLTDFAITSQKK